MPKPNSLAMKIARILMIATFLVPLPVVVTELPAQEAPAAHDNGPEAELVHGDAESCGLVCTHGNIYRFCMTHFRLERYVSCYWLIPGSLAICTWENTGGGICESCA
jgi:hypothetical protein